MQPMHPHQMQPMPPPQKSGMPIGLIIFLVAIPVLVAGIGIFAVLGIYGVRKYIASAKTAEARNTLAMIGRSAIAAYERDGKLCPSASSPVPMAVMHGTKYLSAPGDWEVDSATNSGFSCLKFSLTSPQYYQYDYHATATGFTLTARGDLNGDSVESEFTLTGVVTGSGIVLAPTILETNPEE
jgi:type IV pilus assembly protein PilA